jgi:hypothetical protein
MSSQNLSPDQAYLAMFAFLQSYWERGRSEDIAGLLGSMSLLEDGSPADPALASDWKDAIRLAAGGRVDSKARLPSK